MKIAFFDLDGTITSGMSTENAFIFHLLKLGKIEPKQIFAYIKFFFKWVLTDKCRVFISNKAYLSGISVDEIQNLANQFVDNELINKIRKNIVGKVNEHIKNGDHVVLITGSPEFLANRIANHINISEVYCSKFPVSNGVFTEERLTQHPFSKDKLTIAMQICEKYNAKIEDCYAYGNSMNDRYILSGVGHPVAVTPDPILKYIAKKNNWEIIYSS